MDTPPSVDPESPDVSGVGCAVLLLLFVVCMAGPLMALALVGPWGAAGGAVLSVLAWTFLGARPVPGLVPGLLTVGVWLQGLGVLGVCAVRIARSLMS